MEKWFIHSATQDTITHVEYGASVRAANPQLAAQICALLNAHDAVAGSRTKKPVVLKLTLAQAKRLWQRSGYGGLAIVTAGRDAYEKRAGWGGGPGIDAGRRAQRQLITAIRAVEPDFVGISAPKE